MNNKGKYGVYGGQYVPETLMNPLKEIEKQLEELK